MSTTAKTTVQLQPTTPQSTTKGKSQPTTKPKAKPQQPPKKSKTKEESKPTKKSKAKESSQPKKKSNTKAPTKTQTKPQPTTKALIVVLGRVGVGKSSFINTLAGNDDLRVGHSMERETQLSSVVEISPPNSEDTIAFLDTPGIDGDRPANEVLKYVNGWLKSNRKGNLLFGGFLVLEECHAKQRPEALSLLVGCQSSLVLTKLGYSPNKNEDLPNSANSIIFDPPTQEKAWEIVHDILERSTGVASVSLKTGVVFNNLLQELKTHTRREKGRQPSAISRILALFCIR